jgi:hypothetical protein
MLEPADDRSWYRPELLTRSWAVPAMLSDDERTAIAAAAADLTTRHPKVVDLGCYIGASTMALIDGLCSRGRWRRPRRPVIHSYDLFEANAFMVEHSLGEHGIEPGGDFRAVFERMLGPERRLVTVHAGDIRQERWGGGPIDLLFVDILWGWDINQHVIREFYAPLRPGALVLHQDFIYSFYPWLTCSMEWFVQQGAFSYSHFASPGTVVLRKERALTGDELQLDFHTGLTVDEQRGLVESAAARFDGFPRALLELSVTRLLVDADRSDEALDVYHSVAGRFDGPIVEHHLEMMRAWLADRQLTP